MLPDDKSTTKPFLGTAPSPISVPYVPPLANTFASTNVSTVPMVPNTGKSDAEIVFAGVSNLDLNGSSAQTPLLLESQHSSAAQPIEYTMTTTSHPQIIEVASVAVEQSILNAPTNVTLPPTNFQYAPTTFATVPPTSIPSLNESFNIPSSINPSIVPASVYQTNPIQGKSHSNLIFSSRIQIRKFHLTQNYFFFFYNLNVATSIPTFNQFANVPPPSSISNLPGVLDSVFEPRSTALPPPPQQYTQESQVIDIYIQVMRFYFKYENHCKDFISAH